MNLISKIFCRVYQTAFRIALPIFPYREPKIIESIEDAAATLKKLGKKSVLLITDHSLYELGATAGLESALSENKIKCTVFDKTLANPTAHNVNNAKSLYISENCDSLIALGGGSSMDCAKAVGALIAYPKKSLNQLKGLLKVLKKIPTLVAIPTTAGTGSETTVTAVITDSEKKHKYTMNSFSLIPHYAVLDPAVTATLPPSLTATTGMDALTHAVEAYIGRSTTRETRVLAKMAVKLIFENIETAYSDGSNLTARKNMLHASYIAGIAFSKSYVGYIHAVAHSLGGEYNIAHGLANSVLMPIVLDVYGKAAHKKLFELAVTAGIANECDSHAEGAEKFIKAIRKMNNNMNIPKSFPEIKKEDIPKMARHASCEANPLYPVPKLMNAKELEKIYYKATD